MNIERINARLDTESSRKMRFIKQRTSLSDSDIVRASLDLYYQKLRAESEHRPADGLAKLIGCAEGPEDLSLRYKEDLARSLSKKT